MPVTSTAAAQTFPHPQDALTCNDRPGTRTPSPAAYQSHSDTWVHGYLQEQKRKVLKQKLLNCPRHSLNRPSPGLNSITAFRHDNSALSMPSLRIFTLNSDRIRSKIGATPACCALFRWIVKFGPRNISCGVWLGDLRSIALSDIMCSVSKY